MIACHTHTADAAEIGRNVPTKVDVVIAGAGFAGLYTQYKIRELGPTAFGFEAASEIGGAWYWNRCPGARCDVESLEDSYSFSPEVLNECKWSECFATQPEMLQCTNPVADKYDLRGDFAFETKVIAADLDEAANQLVVEPDHGDDRAYAVSRQLRAGTVAINGFKSDFNIAFGGFKQSGNGREGGIEGLPPYLETKTTIFETAQLAAQ